MKSSDVLRVRDYLEHIEFAIEKIRRYAAGLERASFLDNEEKQDAVIRNIEIVGEAAQSIRRRYPEFAARHPEIPWGGVAVSSNPPLSIFSCVCASTPTRVLAFSRRLACALRQQPGRTRYPHAETQAKDLRVFPYRHRRRVLLHHPLLPRHAAQTGAQRLPFPHSRLSRSSIRSSAIRVS